MDDAFCCCLASAEGCESCNHVWLLQYKASRCACKLESSVALPFHNLQGFVKMATQTNGVTNGDRHLPALSQSAQDFLSHNYDYLIVGGKQTRWEEGTPWMDDLIAARISDL